MEVLSKELLEDMDAEYWVGGKGLPVTDGSVWRIVMRNDNYIQIGMAMTREPVEVIMEMYG